MANLNPTPKQVADAIRDHGVALRLYRGWDTKGREWKGPGGSRGLMGVINHHTATSSAKGLVGAPSLEWCATAFSKPAANMLVGRDKGNVWLLAGGSVFHSGLGGPWPAIGVNSAGNVGHYRLFGIEIDDPGVGKTMTDAQIESVGKINAALLDLCGWGPERIITHGDWTDAGAWLKSPSGVSSPIGPYIGRKNDTLRKYYSATFWRNNAAKYQKSAVKPPVAKPPAPKPTRPLLPTVSAKNVQPGSKNSQVLIVQKALKNQVLLDYTSGPGVFGPKTQEAYARWQRSLGYRGTDADGKPGVETLTILGKKYGFRVVP